MDRDTSRARLFSRRLPGLTVIGVHGELDIVTTATLRNRIIGILDDAGVDKVVIDLSGVSFCDATGLGMLVGARRHAALRGLSLSLAAPRPNMAKLMRITGLDRAFTVHATLADAQLGLFRPTVA